jgi:prepilin-type N-terminal cleavage/methylation domain-containing protein
MTARTRNENGFTLIELLVAIVILAILVTTAVASYLGFRNRGMDAGASANIRAIVPAISAFYNDNTTFVGMTPAALQAYDASIDAAKFSIPAGSLSASSYCVQTASSPYWHKSGPAAKIESGACP